MEVIRGAVPLSSGDGSGSGYGYGYGYGYGSKEYWLSTVAWFALKWTKAQQDRLAYLQNSGATIAFWLSDASGRACNGGSQSQPVAAGTIEKTAGPLSLCNNGTLHATFIPPKWRGDRWWVVALIGDVVHEDDKCGALEREIIGECL